MIAAATNPSAYWYLTRGTGAVSLALLTLTVALGVANVRRVHAERLPRFVIDAVHRNASLLAVVFVAVHVVTSLLDGYAPIRLADVVLPFGSAYRPLWLGFGALSLDLLVAVIVTSLLRRRFGHRAWRATHWLAYASWPVALLHSLGTGSDTRTTWMLVLTGGCLIVVIVAVVARATAGWPQHLGARVTALAGAGLVPLGLLIWLPSGPLAAGWAARAGTPPLLLRAASATPSPSSPGGPSPSGAPPAFISRATGRLRQGKGDDGLSIVDLRLKLPGQKLSVLHIRIGGEPLDGGGVQMTTSRVAFGPVSNPDDYRGVVTALQGSAIQANVHNSAGAELTVVTELAVNQQSGSVSGTVSVRPGGAQ